MRRKVLLLALASVLMSLCIPACGQEPAKKDKKVIASYIIDIGAISDETRTIRANQEIYTKKTYQMPEGITMKELLFSLPGLKKNILGRLITKDGKKTVRTILFNCQLDNSRHHYFTEESDLETFPFSVTENRNLNYTGDSKLYNGTVYVKINNRPRLEYHTPGADLTIEYYQNVSYDAIGGNSEYVDLGLSVKWASRNVDAAGPEELGGLYFWGETEMKQGLERSLTYKFRDGYDGYTKYNGTDEKTVLDPEDDVVHVKLGGSWRMPTIEEFNELKENCTWTWASVNGQMGYLVTSNIPGYTDRSIFLPYFFFGSSGDMNYWSGSLGPYSPGRGASLSINVYEDIIEMSTCYRTWDLPVRPVCP